NAVFPHLPIVVQEAWMSADATHAANFRASLDATALGQQRLSPLLADGLVNPHLATLLATPNPAAPSKGQLLLALTIAVRSGGAMPPVVKNFLIGAAGGAKTTSFPAALHAPALLDGASELEILRNIGLAPGATAVPGGPPLPDDANVDVDQDKTNETFVA